MVTCMLQDFFACVFMALLALSATWLWATGQLEDA